MAEIMLKGNPVHTCGALPPVGAPAPDFLLTKTDLSDIALKDFVGKRIVLNIFPSVDTPVCAASVRRFNEAASGLNNTVVLCVSADLPFAHERFCAAEGLQNVMSVSELRQRKFGEDYRVRIIDGPLAGLLARAVVVIDEQGKIVYTQQVREISQEPDYDDVLRNLK